MLCNTAGLTKDYTYIIHISYIYLHKYISRQKNHGIDDHYGVGESNAFVGQCTLGRTVPMSCQKGQEMEFVADIQKSMATKNTWKM